MRFKQDHHRHAYQLRYDHRPLVTVLVIWVIVNRTPFGFKANLVGENFNMANYAGINSGLMIILTQILGGMLAGLRRRCGAFRHVPALPVFRTPGLWWDGVPDRHRRQTEGTVCPVRSTVLSYLRIGADIMSRNSDIPFEIVNIIQAVMVLLISATAILSGYKKKLIIKETKEFEAAAKKGGTGMNIWSVILSPDFLFYLDPCDDSDPVRGHGLHGLREGGIDPIGTEGIMLSCALAGPVGGYFTHSALGGVIFAMAVGVVLAFVFGYFTLILNTNPVLAGIALNTLSGGLTVFTTYYLTGNKGSTQSLKSPVMPEIKIPLIKGYPGSRCHYLRT